MQTMPSIKIIKHKPTLAPSKCDHCNRIWYGIFCSAETHRIIPNEKTLCIKCWNTLDNYLYEHKEYQEVDSKKCKDSIEWKKNYPQFFESAKTWVENAKPRKRHYSHVPKWAKIAIEAGEMIPNDKYVYTVTTCGDSLVRIEKTLDRSGLQQSIGKIYW